MPCDRGAQETYAGGSSGVESRHDDICRAQLPAAVLILPPRCNPYTYIDTSHDNWNMTLDNGLAFLVDKDTYKYLNADIESNLSCRYGLSGSPSVSNSGAKCHNVTPSSHRTVVIWGPGRGNQNSCLDST